VTGPKYSIERSVVPCIDKIDRKHYFQFFTFRTKARGILLTFRLKLFAGVSHKTEGERQRSEASGEQKKERAAGGK
jgi:hypothetical protein